MYFFVYFSLKKADTSVAEIVNIKSHKNFMFYNTVFKTKAWMVPWTLDQPAPTIAPT
jgi:hypothetical protein